VVVDLPESTWPITTTLMCIFSLLHGDDKSAKRPSRWVAKSRRWRWCWIDGRSWILF